MRVAYLNTNFLARSESTVLQISILELPLLYYRNLRVYRPRKAQSRGTYALWMVFVHDQCRPPMSRLPSSFGCMLLIASRDVRLNPVPSRPSVQPCSTYKTGHHSISLSWHMESHLELPFQIPDHKLTSSTQSPAAERITWELWRNSLD